MTTKNVYACQIEKGDITFYDAPMFSGWKKVERTRILPLAEEDWVIVHFEDGTRNEYRSDSVRPVRLPDLSNVDYQALYGGRSFY